MWWKGYGRVEEKLHVQKTNTVLWNCFNPYSAETLLSTTCLPSFILRHSGHKNVFANKVENNVEPDQLASEKPADLDLHCLHRFCKG